MRALYDPEGLLSAGLHRIRERYKVPTHFPERVLAAAKQATQRHPSEHRDRTAMPFVTLDPANSTDLDQAFCIEQAKSDWLLHYAIADVAWFVQQGDALDREAWLRGTTSYLPDGKASLYPPILSEGGASLLPDGDRPAIILSVRIDQQGEARLENAERALIRNRAKLAYETATLGNLPKGFAQVVERLQIAEQARGASRVDPPEQQLESNSAGGYSLGFRPYNEVESGNAALSLAANLAVADAMMKAGTGLFRTMAAPDTEAETELRANAKAFSISWPEFMPLEQFERGLDPHIPAQAALMLAIRRAGRGARYEVLRGKVPPWHAAIGAPYAHATAPLRRLADRYVLQTVLALANGKPVPEDVIASFDALPSVMSRAGSRDGQIDRAVIDLAEATMLAPLQGCEFLATVTYMRNERASIQLNDLPVIARMNLPGAIPGDQVRVRLTQVSILEGQLEFVAVD